MSEHSSAVTLSSEIFKKLSANPKAPINARPNPQLAQLGVTAHPSKTDSVAASRLSACVSVFSQICNIINILPNNVKKAQEIMNLYHFWSLDSVLVQFIVAYLSFFYTVSLFLCMFINLFHYFLSLRMW